MSRTTVVLLALVALLFVGGALVGSCVERLASDVVATRTAALAD